MREADKPRREQVSSTGNGTLPGNSQPADNSHTAGNSQPAGNTQPRKKRRRGANRARTDDARKPNQARPQQRPGNPPSAKAARGGKRGNEPRHRRRRDEGRFLGDGVYAALDLGTNNCRLLVARPTRQAFDVVDAFSRVVRLGQGLALTGRLAEQAMDRPWRRSRCAATSW